MDRNSRREHFERLCQLRDRYARLGRADTTSIISVPAMIARANRLMNQPVPPQVAAGDSNPGIS